MQEFVGLDLIILAYTSLMRKQRKNHQEYTLQDLLSEMQRIRDLRLKGNRFCKSRRALTFSNGTIYLHKEK